MQTFLHNKIEMAKTNRKYTDTGEEFYPPCLAGPPLPKESEGQSTAE